MLIEIYTITALKRILHSISNKKQRKTKVLFFMMSSLGIRSQQTLVIAEKYRDRRGMKTKLPVQVLIKCADFCKMDMCFFFQ